MSNKKTFIPDEFIEKYRKLLDENDFSSFISKCKTKIPKYIRVNSLKIDGISDFAASFSKKHSLSLTPLPFYRNAFMAESNTSKPLTLGKTEEYKKGFITLQDVSSMIPSLVLSPQANDTEKVLDLCAAPGNKTTQLADLMENKGTLVAVDSNPERMKSLNFNLKRMGVTNTITVNKDALAFNPGFPFNKILLDAPCSSEAFVRKRFDALKNWNKKLVEGKSRLQKKLIQKAFDLLKEEGLLVYSTCSLSPEEDEEVMQYLIENNENARIEKISSNAYGGLKLRHGLTEYKNRKYSSEMKNTVRIYPQDNDSFAFYIAKIRKIK